MFGVRQLTMKVGYKTEVPVRVSFTGGNAIGIKVEVTKKEQVETPVGKNDCFKVETNIGQTFWISDTSERYMAKFEGGGVETLLTSIDHDKPVNLWNEKLKVAVENLRVGDGLAEGTALGPLIEPAAVDKVQEHLDDALAKGGQILTGGKPHALGGQFFEPTIVTNATNEMLVTTDETFSMLS